MFSPENTPTLSKTVNEAGEKSHSSLGLEELFCPVSHVLPSVL